MLCAFPRQSRWCALAFVAGARLSGVQGVLGREGLSAVQGVVMVCRYLCSKFMRTDA